MLEIQGLFLLKIYNNVSKLLKTISHKIQVSSKEYKVLVGKYIGML
jgi:hypothetical protein